MTNARYVRPLFSLASFGLCLAMAATPAHAQAGSPELKAARAMEAARKAGPGELYAFLKPFPKGADLHMHLSGAIYAETFIAEAAQQGACVTVVEKGKPPAPVGQDAVKFVAPEKPGLCPKETVPAADAMKNQELYDNLVDSFSMRAFVPTQGINGHDQFFSTFSRFGGMQDERGAWLDEVASRAASQNEQYLEIMDTPPFKHAAGLGYKIGWPAGAEKSITREQLAELREKLLAGGLRDEVQADIAQYKGELAKRNEIEHCGEATGLLANAGFKIVSAYEGDCEIKIHFLFQVLRAFPPQQVFAQTLLGFEAASADPEDIVGINFVQPEDAYLAMRDYELQMEMLDYLHSVYPNVKVSLHAGEIAPGLVPPDGLSFHIREAIDKGHALRIGHGIDVLYEDNSAALLKQMAKQHVMVEINLTSNDGILGIKGDAHPLHAYMAAHVPWALSTDDEGVNRSDLTHEYMKGVMEQGLTYAQLKQSARTALEHAFLHGESLWAAPDDFTHRRSVCVAAISAKSLPSGACKEFLDANEKASEQWDLERRFAAFEAQVQ
ncbi:adenosine deaminase [Bryocella elongata]|uniref:adenosine deaminase n=1 Tax=Bryocella elongata TaxID=863522 RepID=A0A1H5WNF5_9BACT|nr:adenosine deaminase [Bryocella elongata]SEG00537.1 adenosine deaminase [Bryocella elongata]